MKVSELSTELGVESSVLLAQLFDEFNFAGSARTFIPEHLVEALRKLNTPSEPVLDEELISAMLPPVVAPPRVTEMSPDAEVATLSHSEGDVVPQSDPDIQIGQAGDPVSTSLIKDALKLNSLALQLARSRSRYMESCESVRAKARADSEAGERAYRVSLSRADQEANPAEATSRYEEVAKIQSDIVLAFPRAAILLASPGSGVARDLQQALDIWRSSLGEVQQAVGQGKRNIVILVLVGAGIVLGSLGVGSAIPMGLLIVLALALGVIGLSTRTTPKPLVAEFIAAAAAALFMTDFVGKAIGKLPAIAFGACLVIGAGYLYWQIESAIKSVASECRKARADVEASMTAHLRELEVRKDAHIQEARQLFDKITKVVGESEADALASLERNHAIEERSKKAELQASVSDWNSRADTVRKRPENASWAGMSPGDGEADAFIRLGDFRIDGLDDLMREGYPDVGTVPVLFDTDWFRSILLESHGDTTRSNVFASNLAMRYLAGLPAGMLNLLAIDPVGVGQNATQFMRLRDIDERLMSPRAWSEPRDIELRLEELINHTATMIQGYLRNEYESLVDYNAAAPIPIPYRLLLVYDFPSNFTDTAIRRLESLVQNGPKAGVIPIVVWDKSRKAPHGVHVEGLRDHCLVFNEVAEGYRTSWKPLSSGVLKSDQPPTVSESNAILDSIAEAANKQKNAVVTFSRLLRDENIDCGKLWQASRSSSEGLSVPLGPMGSARRRYLNMGFFDVERSTENHALIIGTTGSGKTNLIHVIIGGLCAKYAPEEVRLFLVDFKEGVEFKPYASGALPHAEVIAIESEREFGLSVLRKLDATMTERAALFKPTGKGNILDFRNATGEVLPRLVLVMDEYQELFKVDDAIGNECKALLESLVRKGRSYGIHVILGSQSLTGSATLNSAILDQIAIRIVMRIDFGNAERALGSGIKEAMLPTKTGEALYKIAGKVGDDLRFQTARMDSTALKEHLDAIRLSSMDRESVPVVFEGDLPGELASSKEIVSLSPHSNRFFDLLVGDPVELSPAVSFRLSRQAGGNGVFVGLEEEQTMGAFIAAWLSLIAQRSRDTTRYYLFDQSSPEGTWCEIIDAIAREIGNVTILRAANVQTELEGIVAELDSGLDLDRFVLLLGPQRSSAFAPKGHFGDSDPLSQILRMGPENRVHVLAVVDTVASLRRVCGRELSVFGHRVIGQLSDEEQREILDSKQTAKSSRRHRMIVYDNVGREGIRKCRPFGVPDPNWVRDYLSTRM